MSAEQTALVAIRWYGYQQPHQGRVFPWGTMKEKCYCYCTADLVVEYAISLQGKPRNI